MHTFLRLQQRRRLPVYLIIAAYSSFLVFQTVQIVRKAKRGKYFGNQQWPNALMRMQLLDILSGTADSVAATVKFANVVCYECEIDGFVICTECTQVYLIVYICVCVTE